VLWLCEREWPCTSATRGCRSFHSRVLVPPSSMAVPPARPQPACAELPFQPAPQQLQHIPRGIDIPVPEVCLASTVGTAQDVPGELEYDLHARDLGRGTRRRAARHRAITEHVDPRTTSSSTACTCPRGTRRRCQARSSSVLSRSVVTRRVMNEAQSCSIVPALVEARTTKGRLGGSDADTLLRTVVTQM
jgi:hypothetical protein